MHAFLSIQMLHFIVRVVEDGVRIAKFLPIVWIHAYSSDLIYHLWSTVLILSLSLQFVV